MYKPEFTMTDRRGKTALWVLMPNNKEYNIGDIDKTALSKVENAIIHAFELGYAARGMIDTSMSLSYNATFMRGNSV